MLAPFGRNRDLGRSETALYPMCSERVNGKLRRERPLSEAPLIFPTHSQISTCSPVLCGFSIKSPRNGALRCISANNHWVKIGAAFRPRWVSPWYRFLRVGENVG